MNGEIQTGAGPAERDAKRDPTALRRQGHAPWTMFKAFFQVGIMGFGGTLPFARRMLVDQRKWMTPAEFADLFSLCQFLPGANIVNMTFAFGARNRGIAGAAAAITGLLAAPIAIVLCLAGIYERYGHIPVVQHGLSGLAAAGAGLIMAAALKIAVPVLKSPRTVLIAAGAFAMIVFAHVSLVLTMVVLVPVSLLLALRS